MIRLKDNIDEKTLEQYGFKKRSVREWDRKEHCVYYRTTYCYDFENFQSVDIYIEPFLDAWGNVVYNAREVVACEHAYKVDKAVDLIAKLLLAGVFEYVETNAK